VSDLSAQAGPRRDPQIISTIAQEETRHCLEKVPSRGSQMSIPDDIGVYQPRIFDSRLARFAIRLVFSSEIAAESDASTVRTATRPGLRRHEGRGCSRARGPELSLPRSSRSGRQRTENSVGAADIRIHEKTRSGAKRRSRITTLSCCAHDCRGNRLRRRRRRAQFSSSKCTDHRIAWSPLRQPRSVLGRLGGNQQSSRGTPPACSIPVRMSVSISFSRHHLTRDGLTKSCDGLEVRGARPPADRL